MDSKLLINENPMLVLPSLAEKIGLDEALALQQIHFWITNHQIFNNEKTYREGKWWVFNTIQSWRDNQFKWLSVETVKRIFKRLEQMGLIISRKFEAHNKTPNQRKWYSTVPEKIEAIANLNIEGWKLTKSELVKLIRSVNPVLSAAPIAETPAPPELVNLTHSSRSDCPDPELVNLTHSSRSDCANDLYKRSFKRSKTTLSRSGASNVAEYEAGIGEERERGLQQSVTGISQPQALASQPIEPEQFNGQLNGSEQLEAVSDTESTVSTLTVNGASVREGLVQDQSFAPQNFVFEQSAKPAPKYDGKKAAWLEVYNPNKPPNWPEKQELDMREVMTIDAYVMGLCHSGDRTEAEADMYGRSQLALALAYMRLHPAFYCQPNHKGQELQLKGIGWLLSYGPQGRFITVLADQAKALNINPDAVNAAFHPEFGDVPAAVQRDKSFLRYIGELNQNPTPRRRAQLEQLITITIEEALQNA